jgi:hypothetical protein
MLYFRYSFQLCHQTTFYLILTLRLHLYLQLYIKSFFDIVFYYYPARTANKRLSAIRAAVTAIAIQHQYFKYPYSRKPQT